MRPKSKVKKEKLFILKDSNLKTNGVFLIILGFKMTTDY